MAQFFIDDGQSQAINFDVVYKVEFSRTTAPYLKLFLLEGKTLEFAGEDEVGDILDILYQMNRVNRERLYTEYVSACASRSTRSKRPGSPSDSDAKRFAGK